MLGQATELSSSHQNYQRNPYQYASPANTLYPRYSRKTLGPVSFRFLSVGTFKNPSVFSSKINTNGHSFKAKPFKTATGSMTRCDSL